jgi:hypothetical protein
MSDMKVGTLTEGFREEGVEENIWTEGDVVIGGCRRLPNEELHNLYFCQV